jgi:hypothetical protein
MKVTQIELEDIPLDRTEFNALLLDPHAWDALFNDVNGKIEPVLKRVKALQLKESVAQAYVSIVHGLHEAEVEFKEVKLSKVCLELRDGGEVAMSCKVRGPATLDESFGLFMDKLGDSIEVEMRFEPPGQQQSLPLNSVGANERGTSSVGTPAQERAKAREREAKPASGKGRKRKASDGATIN